MSQRGQVSENSTKPFRIPIRSYEGIASAEVIIWIIVPNSYKELWGPRELNPQQSGCRVPNSYKELWVGFKCVDGVGVASSEFL